MLTARAQSPDALLRFIGAPPHGTPFVPCWDFSGIVHELGSGVLDYKVGDEVFGVLFNMTGESTRRCIMDEQGDCKAARRSGGGAQGATRQGKWTTNRTRWGKRCPCSSRDGRRRGRWR